MASPIAQETLSALDQWLSDVGFTRGNPFGANEADREPSVPECFVDPGIYNMVRDEMRAALVFAPRGFGKTALCVMLASDCRPLQPTEVNPRSQSLAVIYSDFEPALNACDYDLARLASAHHVASILHNACAAFLDALWQDIQLIENLSLPDRSLFAAYCRQYNLPLLGADAVYRRLQSACSEIDIPWLALRKAVAGQHLGTVLQEYRVPITPALRLYAELVDDIPDPLANVDSPVRVLAGFAQLVQRVGLQRLYILVDRLDEQQLTQDPTKLAAVLAPLISNLPLMDVPGVTFRLFLPREAREAILPYVRPERLQELEVKWNTEQLRELLRLRLRVYSSSQESVGQVRNVDLVQSLNKLCEDTLANHIENEMIELADGSPRRLLQLGATLLKTHVTISPGQRLITQTAWTQTLGKLPARPLRIDRQAGKVYLGATTPVDLQSIPYNFVFYLYEAKGFRTNREIATAVWKDPDLESTDVKIRKTVQRIKDALRTVGADPDHYLVNEPGRGYMLKNVA